MPGGRPSKLTPDRQEKIANAVALGMDLQGAADLCGISYGCLNRWENKGREAKSGKFYEFYHALKLARAKGEGVLLGYVHKAAKDGCWQAAMRLLESRKPHVYGRGPAVMNTINASGENVLVHADEVRVMSKDELAEAVKELSDGAT